MIRLDSRAAQLHRSMHVFQRVGFCDIDLAGDTQSAILSADPSGAFEIAVRYRLHRDAAFAAWCTLFIDETSRGIETLLLTDEVAALETEIGGDLDQSGVRVIRSEVDRLLGDQLLRIRC